MLAYALRRLSHALPVLLVVSLITFALIHIVPGDAAQVIAGPDATRAQVEGIRAALGLDRPLYVQLGLWYWRVLHGDLGDSYMLGRSVVQAIGERVPVTVLLSLYSLAITLPLGLLAGIVAATNHNRWLDAAVMTVALLGVSVPGFWLSIMGIVLFSVSLGWLPATGYVPPHDGVLECLRSLTLPAVSLAVFQIGFLARMVRATMLEVLRQDFIRTARAEGIAEWKILAKHALKNIMTPILTAMGIILAVVLAGAVVVEQIFALPGLGRLVVEGILRRDYPVIQGSLLVVAGTLVLVNLAIDLLYGVLDPRVHYG
jgi:peptide/nickel transport system permease protein